MKDWLINISRFITVLSIILCFICVFYNYEISAAEYETTWDPTPVDGYHKKKNGIFKTHEHNFEPDKYSESAWVYSDCETFTPTEQELLNSVHAVSKDSDRKIEVVSREIKEYSVSELLKQQKYSLYNNGKKVFTKQLVVGIKNAENKSVAYVPLAVPYICNHEDSLKSCNAFYSRYVMYVWCDELNTWVCVGNKHYWYGCALGDVGKPSLNSLPFTHTIYEYYMIPDTQTVKFDSNIDDDYDETTAKITDSTLSNMPLQFKSTYNVVSYIPDETPTREGYTFVCWYTAEGKRYMPGDQYSHDTSVADKGTVYLYAKWTANTYKISYSLGGGTHGASHPDSAAYNESFTISNPSRNGYKFKGWKITGMTNSMHTIDGVSGISGTSYSGATGTKFKNLRNISGTVTFTAEWESTSTTPPKKTTAPLASYKIKYNLNGGTHGASHPDSAGMTEKINISNPSKTGCKFKGWDITGAGKNYLIGASYPYVTSLTGVTETTFSQMGADGSTVTFTAAWEKIKYSLQIDYNGGTQNTSVTNTNSSALFAQKAGSYTDIETGKEITVAVPVKTGYKFTGWKIEGYENTYDEQLWTSFRSPNWQHMDDIVSSGIITTDFCKDSAKNTYALQNLRSTAGTVKLTAQWEKKSLNINLYAADEDNPVRFYDDTIKERYKTEVELIEKTRLKNGEDEKLVEFNAENYWYKDEVNITAEAKCNYAGIKNVYQYKKYYYDIENAKGGYGISSFKRIYSYDRGKMSGEIHQHVFIEGKVTAEDGSETECRKYFMVDAENPVVYELDRSISGSSVLIEITATDAQSGLDRIEFQKKNADGTWTVEESQNYEPHSTGRTELDFEYPFSEDRDQFYRYAVYDNVGHYTYSSQFSLGKQLALNAELRRTDGTAAGNGETLEMYENAVKTVWADCYTSGFADRLEIEMPDELSVTTHQAVSLDGTVDKNSYTFEFQCNDSTMVLGTTYAVKIKAWRGDRWVSNTINIDFKRKNPPERFVVSSHTYLIERDYSNFFLVKWMQDLIDWGNDVEEKYKKNKK